MTTSCSCAVILEVFGKVICWSCNLALRVFFRPRGVLLSPNPCHPCFACLNCFYSQTRPHLNEMAGNLFKTMLHLWVCHQKPEDKSADLVKHPSCDEIMKDGTNGDFPSSPSQVKIWVEAWINRRLILTLKRSDLDINSPTNKMQYSKQIM